MKLEHLRAFLWLRTRIRLNQLRKGGIANIVVLVLVGLVLFGTAVGGTIGLFAAGYGVPADAPSATRLLIWDGVVLALLFVWMTTLMADLQRSEALAIDKFLHLPVSPAGAFLVNYLSSLISVTALVFVPAFLGLALGQAFALGPLQLLALPLFAAFFFALTAVTYQFQGWLAALMSNPRRRRTVIVVLTLGFILLAQGPNLFFNVIRPWDNDARDQPVAGAKDAKGPSFEELKRRHEESERQTWAKVQQTSWLANVALPPGWLPLGAAELANGNPLSALLGTAGLMLIGSWSLWRAYRTTLGIYTGQGSAGDGRTAAPATPAVPDDPTKRRMMEWQLPLVSEPAAAVALAGMRSLTRAPEAKMLLLTPFILLVIFGAMMARSSGDMPEAVRPLVAFGAAAMGLFCTGQLIGNQFGYDRSGFRAYVLGPAPRRDILLGKNLAVAPLVAAITIPAVAVVAVVYPMRIDHLLAVPFQCVSMFLIFCLLANLLSMYAPMAIAPGAFQASNVKFLPVLLHMAFLMLLPFALAPTLLPYGVEALLDFAGWSHGWPVALGLTVLVTAGVVLLYRVVLDWEGDVLAGREQKILEAVTQKEE